MLEIKYADRYNYVAYMGRNEGTRIERIKSPTPPNIHISDNEIGFILFDQLVVGLVENGIVVELKGEVENESGIYYVDGHIYAPSEVEMRYPEETELINRLRYIESNVDKNVKTIKIKDKFYIYRGKDHLYDPKARMGKESDGTAPPRRGKTNRVRSRRKQGR